MVLPVLMVCVGGSEVVACGLLWVRGVSQTKSQGASAPAHLDAVGGRGAGQSDGGTFHRKLKAAHVQSVLRK